VTEDLTKNEEELVEYARERIKEHARKRWENDLYDILYAFVLSETGEIYEGKPFESSQPSFNFCAERHAINQMQFEETEESKIEAVLVAGPVPDKDHKGTMPCGACRHTINEFGDEETTVIISNFVRKEGGEWNLLPQIQKFQIQELYPEAYEPVEWD
jgi:cytidine deaminase